MKIPFNVLDRQYEKYQEEYEQKALEVLRRGRYVLGAEVEQFEEEFAKYCGSSYCVGLASGLDALWLALKILGIETGDEVIVQSNTYIATVMGITINGATPVFVEPDEYNNMDPSKIESRISSKTKAILVTHLYGQASDMEKIARIAKKHGLYLIEDCAQAHGARFGRKMVGAFGVVGCYSFYPSKNLGAFGDGGAIVCDDEEIARKFRMYRNYGSEKRYHNQVIGANSRLDELQAALLRVKLSHLQELNDERCRIANRYLAEVKNKYIELPKTVAGATHVYHLFVVRTKYRDELQQYLSERDIGSEIHYPIPPHLQTAYKCLGQDKGSLPIAERYANEVLSLPLYIGMTRAEQDYVIKTLNGFKPNETT